MRRSLSACAFAPASARASRGRSLTATVLWAGLLALAILLVWSLAAAPGNPEGLSGPWSWLPMLAFGGVCALAGLLWGRQSLAHQLRSATQNEQSLTELADSFVWRSDAQHRVQGWRPPHGAAPAAWVAEQALGLKLFDRFEVLDPDTRPGALQARLDAHALIPELRVVRLGMPGQPVWRLRALPQFDAHGDFLGYLGTATPLGESEQRVFDQAVLQRLWPELDVAAVALVPDGRGWRIAAISPDAARLLQLDPHAPEGMRDWAGALAKAPRELIGVIEGLAPGQSATTDQWQLEMLPLDSETGQQPGRLLLLRPLPGAAPEEAAISAADHESFIYSVSHDLRAPLRVVEGFARILKEDYGRFLDRIGNDHVDRVLSAGARMNSMIDALLALSRLQSQPLARKPVDLSQLAGFIIEDLRREAPDRQASIHIEAGLVVQGDPTLLRIALENLLGNAWKYSGQNPQTVIEFRCERQADGRRVYVVADQGAGFDMRFADRLFGVFQRLHSPTDFQGTGVGLASVRRILRRHGGDIWAESEVGKGARFYFTV
ncbi:ATP-binding protein [Ideonella azotifigens]|uniref:sensor histidine kinase n=3 Tax=Ideonella azotifigens TaxID=513160 RepID=UPI001E601D88|nr:ATP-binding protein [Ideonella azotifigens]MCD2342154.1 ATP-binding protein [Ideonella azotifigens]